VKRLRFIGACSIAFSWLVAAACGDDDAIVRGRLDGGTSSDAAADVGTGCNVTPPATYDSPTFETNAAQELALRKALDDFLAPMKTVEAQSADGGVPTPVTKAQLEQGYAAGTPSVKSASTEYFQNKVTAWIGAYDLAITDGIYTPATPDGGDKGGRYGGYIFDATGLDLHQAIENGTYGAAFYAEAAALVASGTITVGTIDRLVAVFGAHPSFPNSPDAPQNRDVFAAAHAARRDSKDAANPGPYQRIRSAILKARAYVEAGDRCKAERDAVLKLFLREWERSSYGTVIYDLNDVTTRLIASTTDLGPVLHTYGEAVGLIAGFRTIPQDSRIITDAQIDGLLSRVFAPDGGPVEVFKVKTSPLEVVSRFGQAIADIKTVYSLSDAEVEAFKKKY
jgi:hypothetical protein